MGEIKKGNHIMKLFNWLRWLFRRDVESEQTNHDDMDREFWREFDRDFDRMIERGARISSLSSEIDRLRRNKKKHSHLQKELDALIDSGADMKTNNGDTQ